MYQGLGAKSMVESGAVLMGEKPPSSIVVVCHGPAHPHELMGMRWMGSEAMR